MSGKWAHFEDAALRKGFAQVPNMVMRDGRLSMQAKYLYGLLLSYAWQNDEAHPGVKTLCEAAGVGKDTLGKYMHELADAGLIEVRRRGRGMTNLYIFKALSRGLESDTGSHLDGDRGSVPDGDTGSHKEYSVNEYSEEKENAPKGAAASRPPDEDFEGWQIEEYIRTELERLDRPYTRPVIRRYTRQANSLFKRGADPEEIYEAADRVVSEWERVRLTLDDALRDVQNGSQTNGTRPPSHEERSYYERKEEAKDKPYAAAWYASLYPDVAERDIKRWIAEGLTHSEIEEKASA